MALATDCNECILLDGISANNCRGDLGGIFSRISLAPACTVASKTKTGSLISAITMYEVSVGVDYNWLTVQTKRNTGIVDELSDLNGIITQSVTLVISNYSDNADLETAASEQAEFLNNLKKNDELILVAKDSLGVRRMYGYTGGMYVVSIDKLIPAEQTAPAVTTIVLNSIQSEFAPAIDSAVIGNNIILPN